MAPYEATLGSFRTRSVELFLSTVMAAQGAIFLIPGKTLDLPHYAYASQWVDVWPGSEVKLGFLLLVLGTARFVAIIINGHWRPTPAFRLAGCMVGSLHWMMLTLSFALAEVHGTPAALGWTIPALFFETLSAVRVTTDALHYNTFGIRRWLRARHLARGGS